MKVQKLSLPTLDYIEAYTSLIRQWGKKSHLTEIIQLLEGEKNINIKIPKTLEADAVIDFVLGTAEHAFLLYLTPGLPYIQLQAAPVRGYLQLS